METKIYIVRFSRFDENHNPIWATNMNACSTFSKACQILRLNAAILGEGAHLANEDTEEMALHYTNNEGVPCMWSIQAMVLDK